ncbi:unnamed protein product, partial [Didymodactylos carnosus]
MGVRLHLDSSD